MSLQQAPQRQAQNSAAVYLTAPQTKARYGGISDMTLWRWLTDPDLGFPQPLVINRRRLFSLEELEDFDQRHLARVTEAA